MTWRKLCTFSTTISVFLKHVFSKMAKVSNFIPSPKKIEKKLCKRDFSLPLSLMLSACARWVGGECNLPWSAPRISPPSACCPSFIQRRRRRRCRATRAGLESLRLPVRSATRCMMRVPQPQRHSRARTPRILRAKGGSTT